MITNVAQQETHHIGHLTKNSTNEQETRENVHLIKLETSLDDINRWGASIGLSDKDKRPRLLLRVIR